MNGQWLAYQSAQPATAITLITYRGPDQGFAAVLIDGQNQGILDLYAPTPEYQVHQVYGGLANSQHLILVMATGQKNPASAGTQIRVDGFQVNGNPIDEAHPGVIYRSWSGLALQWAYGGSFRMTTRANAVVTFVMEGSEFSWITARGPLGGDVVVLVDGAPALTVSTYNPTWQFQYEQVVSGLLPGSHVIQIRSLTAGSLVVFDGYSVP